MLFRRGSGTISLKIDWNALVDTLAGCSGDTLFGILPGRVLGRCSVEAVLALEAELTCTLCPNVST